MKREEIHMFFGLKWNPFHKTIPIEGMVVSPRINHFCWRVENLVMDGGFAMITGGPGFGKSAALRILEDRLSKLREIQIGTLMRPQSGLADFYREMGERFSVDLKVSNRWGAFKNLRLKWREHLDSTLFHPVLLIDEAQEMLPLVLSELRFLSSEKFDSKSLLTIILSGDERLKEKFRIVDLEPLKSRISVQLSMDPLSKEELSSTLKTCLDKAGNPALITKEVIDSLSEHSAGNLRIMMTMANELLENAFKKEAKKIDEKIFLETFDHLYSTNGQNQNNKKRR